MEIETIDKSTANNDFTFGCSLSEVNIYTDKIINLQKSIDELKQLIDEKDNKIVELNSNVKKIQLDNYDLKEKLNETEKNSEIIEVNNFFIFM